MGEARSFVLPESWKKDLLNKLSINRSGVIQTNGITWHYFKMPSSWVRNGDLSRDKFNPLDEIVSRGERGKPVKIYESTDPRLAKYLYIRRTNSYSMWRVPRPNLRETIENETNRISQGQRGLPIRDSRVSNIARGQANPDRVASLPSDVLERMIQLPQSTWDSLGRIRPDMWTRLLAVATEDRTARQQRPTRPGIRQRRDPSSTNPSDRGDCPPRPSRIPIPIEGRRRRSAQIHRLPEPESVTPMSRPLPAPPTTPPAQAIAIVQVAAGPTTTCSSSTQTEQCPGTTKVSKSTSIQRLPALPRLLKGEKAAHPTPLDRRVVSHKRDETKSATKKWWSDELAVSPRLMKVETLCEAAVNIRREDDGELVELGRGHFSVVYLADISQYSKNCFVAVKMFNKGTSPSDIKKEAGFLRVLADTGFVPHLYGYLVSSSALVQECFGQATTLEDLLSAAHAFGLPKASWCDIAIHLSVAVREFFKRGVLHNDIKSENILVDWSTHGYPVKLIDFGRATYKTGYLYTKKTAALAKENQLAPELNLSTQTTTASEIFSIGVVLQSIAQKGLVRELTSIVEPCLRHNPSERPCIHTVIKLLKIQQRHLH